MRRQKQAKEPPSPHFCAVEGCLLSGEYKAPRSRESLRDYQWLCLEHVQAFNRAWDYFDGMNSEQIEAFMQDALTGHRPTWERESHLNGRKHSRSSQMEEEVYFFLHWDSRTHKKRTPERKIPAKERRALKALYLEEPCDLISLKKHYRALVKQHHPDLHKGDPEKVEIFKKISTAFSYLETLYK